MFAPEDRDLAAHPNGSQRADVGHNTAAHLAGPVWSFGLGCPHERHKLHNSILAAEQNCSPQIRPPHENISGNENNGPLACKIIANLGTRCADRSLSGILLVPSRGWIRRLAIVFNAGRRFIFEHFCAKEAAPAPGAGAVAGAVLMDGHRAATHSNLIPFPRGAARLATYKPHDWSRHAACLSSGRNRTLPCCVHLPLGEVPDCDPPRPGLIASDAPAAPPAS